MDFHGQRSCKTKFSVSFTRAVNSVFLRIVYPLNIKNTAVCPTLYVVHATAMEELRLLCSLIKSATSILRSALVYWHGPEDWQGDAVLLGYEKSEGA